MSSIIVCGGGVCGLATGLLLARDGHDVTLLERDPGDVPATVEEAWDDWERKGVAQFRQPHNLFPGFRVAIDRELPEINDALRDNGAARMDFSKVIPPHLDQSPRPIDEDLWFYTGRRPYTEWIFARAAADEPRLDVRRGAQVVALLAGPSVTDSVPHVTGVKLADGTELFADLVVDAMGRRSSAPKLIADIGGRPVHEEAEDDGFMYYTRFFRGSYPPFMGPIVMEAGTISVLTLWGDNGTWSATFFAAAGDQPMKQLRRADVWTKVLSAFPLQAHWADGEPLTDVLPMSGVIDRYRRFTDDGVPCATGFAAVADAWCCTNPSAGRGLSVGLRHAIALRDLVRTSLDDPARFALEWDAVTVERFKPWYDAQVEADRARLSAMEAQREGREWVPPTSERWKQRMLIFAGVGQDADLFRGAMSFVGCLKTADELLADEEFVRKARAAQESAAGQPPPAMPAPSRQELLDLVS